jgi:hypothetical protein
MSDRIHNARSERTWQGLLRLLRHARFGGFRRRRGEMTLGELEDSRRPLLFRRLPRMLRRDGTIPKSVQAAFGYLDQDQRKEAAVTVSPQRWSRALETSCRLAARRSARERR